MRFSNSRASLTQGRCPIRSRSRTNTAIAKRMGLTGMTVGKWRKRYRDLVLEGLDNELRPGRAPHL